MTSEGRAEQLADSLAAVRGRIAAAAAGVDRDPAEITLVVVTKFFPASDVVELARLGVTDVGENRDQEAASKLAQVRESGGPVPRVHFVGTIQSNKAASVAGYADVVHSLDRPKIVRALDRAAAAAGRRLDVLLQVSLDEDASRGGAPLADVPELADLVTSSEALELRGLMAVAPLAARPADAFASVAQAAAELAVRHPSATWLSAGMSGDLEEAVAAGATHLRVGSAILGPRPRRG